MTSFPINWDRYKGKGPVYKQPKEITSYSIDHERQVWFDDRQLRYYYPAKGRDLSLGYEKYIERDSLLLEHLDTLLDALTDLRSHSNDPDIAKADIITWRGIMTKILCTPFARNEPWALRASKHNGTIYIEEHQLEDKGRMNDRQHRMCYWGYKFETLSTVGNPPEKEAPSQDELDARLVDGANTNEQYCVVVRTTLGKTQLIMGAEVDCSQEEKTPSKDPLRSYVELKTSRKIDHDRQHFNFERHKLLKFWAQSFLIGVPKVICGFRDDDGMIDHTETFPTLKIPRMVRDKPGMWDPNLCLNFADHLLRWIQSAIVHDDPTKTYLIQWRAPWDRIDIQDMGHKDVFLTQRFLDGQVSHSIGGRRVTHEH